MKKSKLLRVLCVLVTSLVLICIPESSFAAGGHGGGGGGFHGGGGGGFHGGGGGFHGGGGGFHGGGFGGYRGGWGGSGWRGGWGGYGWRGGWGYGRGWGYPGWGRGWGWGYPGWGWGIGFGVGWGWGSYWGGYPYAYGYPYYPYYPYYGPNGYAPADPDRYNGTDRDPRANSPRQNSNYPAPQRSPGVNGNNSTVTFANRKTAGDTDSATYWLTNYQQRTVPRQQVRNVIQAFLAMPPEARQRQIESGRYRNFSPEEQELLNQVAKQSPRAEPQNNTGGKKPAGLSLASQQVQ
jgi:hypothetical protein